MHSTWYNINCRLDDYAASIQLKGCPLGNCVAFVDGSHVPGIMTDKIILGIHYFGISGGEFGNIYKTLAHAFSCSAYQRPEVLVLWSPQMSLF